MSDTAMPEEEATADAGLSVSGPLPLFAEATDTVNALQPFAQVLLAPAGAPAPVVRAWFDEAARAVVPEHDGTVGTARLAAQAYARHAKSDNTRLAYRAGVRAWCAWCDQHDLPCLPGRSEDVVAFLAAERGRGLSLGTVDLRLAAIRYLHFVAGCPVPTAEAHVAETMAGMRRHAADRGEAPEKKLAATAAILRDILATIPGDLPGLRDRALLLSRLARHVTQMARGRARPHKPA